MSLLNLRGFILAAGRKPSEGIYATDPVVEIRVSLAYNFE